MHNEGRSTAGSPQLNPSDSAWRDLAFPQAEYDRRVAEVRQAMVDRQIDVLLIQTPENINYLTGYDTIGYSSYLCLALPVDVDPVLVIREMERGVAMSTTWLTSIATSGDTDDPVERTVDALTTRNLLSRRIAMEGSAPFVTPSTWSVSEPRSAMSVSRTPDSSNAPARSNRRTRSRRSGRHAVSWTGG